MKIHYKKDLNSPDKIIDNVIYIGIIDGNETFSIVLEGGRELNIKPNRIEAIIDNTLFKNNKTGERKRNLLKYCEDRINILETHITSKKHDEYYNAKIFGGIRELKIMVDILANEREVGE